MADAKIGKPRWAVITSGNIAGDIDHVIVDALIPAQRRGRYDVAIGGQGIPKYAAARRHDWARHRRQCPGDTGGALAEPARHTHGQLSAEYRRCESIGWREDDQIALAAQAQVQIDVHIGGNSAYRDLSCCRNVAECADVAVVVDHAERPAGNLRRGGKTRVLSRKPE